MKQRILIVNKFYYPRGGDCVCALNLESLLKDQGFEVAVYAMNHPDNIQSQYSQYFADEVSFAGGITQKLKAAERSFGMGDIVHSINKLLDDFHPDVVHLHNVHSYISPVIGQLAKRRGCKVVWTLHDYKLLCPSYSCLRGGQTCELCFHNKSQVIRNRCMKGSLAGSILAYIEAKKWNRAKLESFTDTFICPSQFMADKMAQGGFDTGKLKVICNSLDAAKVEKLQNAKSTKRGNYMLYVGRISAEKGIETLLKAASRLPYQLQVGGDGPLLEQYKNVYASSKNISFLGRLNADGVCDALSRARFSVIPSEWYENNPLSVIESLCAGTPVVGANIGGIPELIDDENGTIFTSGDVVALSDAINKEMNMIRNNAEIKRTALKRFSPQEYIHKTISVYDD
jgi:glycosyltransferase involved in cell wall biosynthesis